MCITARPCYTGMSHPYILRTEPHYHLQLCYTKGTAIPCVLFVESPDAQALDILSSPKAVDVRLQRCVTYSSIPPSQRTHAVRKEWNTSFDFPSSATFWPGPPCENPHQRQLDGEIQLSPHLKPSCAIMHFSITASPSFHMFLNFLLIFTRSLP